MPDLVTALMIAPAWLRTRRVVVGDDLEFLDRLRAREPTRRGALRITRQVAVRNAVQHEDVLIAPRARDAQLVSHAAEGVRNCPRPASASSVHPRLQERQLGQVTIDRWQVHDSLFTSTRLGSTVAVVVFEQRRLTGDGHRFGHRPDRKFEIHDGRAPDSQRDSAPVRRAKALKLEAQPFTE